MKTNNFRHPSNFTLACFVLSALAMLSFVSRASAIDYLSSVNHPLSVSGLVATVQSGDRFLVDLTGARSYSCQGIPSASDSTFALGLTVSSITTPSTQVTARATGTLNPPITEGTGAAGQSRLSLTPTATGRYAFDTTAAKTGGEPIQFACVETTLIGGFNTFINNFNFLELTNLTASTVTGTVTAIDFAGNTVINAQAFSVAANRRADIDLHTTIGPEKFGTVIVTHNAPFGGLQGYVSQYRGTAASFDLRATVPLLPATPPLQ